MTSELVGRLRIEDARYPGDTLYGAAADEIKRLTAQLAEARQAERAAVVAWLRSCLKGYVDPWGKAADAIEAGEHLK